MGQPNDVFIVDAVRTPIGRHGGALAGVRPDDLAATVVRALMARLPTLDPVAVEECFFGAANGAGKTTAMWPAWRCCWPGCRRPFPAQR